VREGVAGRSTVVAGLHTVVAGPLTVDSSPHTIVAGPLTVVAGLHTVVAGPLTLVAGRPTVVAGLDPAIPTGTTGACGRRFVPNRLSFDSTQS